MTIDVDSLLLYCVIALIASFITYYKISRSVKREIQKSVKGITPEIIKTRLESEERISRVKKDHSVLELQVQELKAIVGSLEERFQSLIEKISHQDTTR